MAGKQNMQLLLLQASSG